MARGIAVLLLAVALCSVARGEDLLPWDGREVTDLAEKLRDEVEAAATAADTSMSQSSLAAHTMRSRARSRLASLLEVTEQLVTELLQVQGPDRTKLTFDVVLERAALVRRFMNEEKPSRKLWVLWVDAEATRRHIARYYGSSDPVTDAAAP